MPEKTITGWLVINWKDGTHRTRKSKPKASELGSNELLAELSIDVEIPEVEVPTLAVQIDVPEPQVYQAVLEGIDEADLPDWSAAVNDVIAAERERIEAVDPMAVDDLVDQLTTQALLDAPGRPPVDQVRAYVGQQVDRILEEGETHA